MPFCPGGINGGMPFGAPPALGNPPGGGKGNGRFPGGGRPPGKGIGIPRPSPFAAPCVKDRSKKDRSESLTSSHTAGRHWKW